MSDSRVIILRHSLTMTHHDALLSNIFSLKDYCLNSLVAVRAHRALRWALFLLAGLLTLLSSAPSFGAKSTDKPQRIVSMNLCTDQLLILLAEPERIMSVSYLSAEPHSSHVATEVVKQDYPLNHNLPEEVIPLKPDLVVTGTFLHQAETRLIKAAGIRVESFPVFNSLNDVKGNIRKMAAVLGEKERGEAIISSMEQRQRELMQDLPAGDIPAVTYHARGYTQGTNTLSDELMTLAGFHNIARDFNIDGYGSIDLESLVRVKPHVMITSEYSPGTRSVGQYFLQHPVLTKLFPDKTQRIELQTRNLICGGPMNLNALQTLIEHRHALAN